MATEHGGDLRWQCAPEGFAVFDPERFPRTTLPSLALAAAAYRYTGPVGERVSLALRDALWEQGRDISDTEVLAEIATAHGIVDGWGPADERSVTEDWHLGQKRGVKSSPQERQSVV